MSRTAAGWLRWYRRWEKQQETLNRNRERRFYAMLDIVAANLSGRFTALDLGSGPGSLSARLLTRFPRARCVAVDFDPVVQRIGRGALGTFDGRLRWVEADVGRLGWERTLPGHAFDAALSTTALHWLDRPRLTRLYRDLGRLLRRGGIFVNGDRIPWGTDRPDLGRIADAVRGSRLRRAGHRPGWHGWDVWNAWWDAARRDPELGPLFTSGSARSHPRRRELPLSVHVRGLEEAGFRSVDVVWRDFEDVVLFARR